MIPQQRKAAQFDLPPGTMLGKYEVIRKLAMGGMAEIYLTRITGQAGFEKLVVIKRILPTVANDPTFVQMFLDEARLAATLHHPNIADVYEVGDHEGSPFFAMEFIHGQDVRAIKMAARERKEALPLAISLAIIHGTASALDYAHDRTGPDGKNLGLVHRDVSTSNILVSYDGAIKLIDFGIARATSRTSQTTTGTLKGKIPYMSPEQCRGQPLDRRSDLWSLGVIMYELTAGRRPFRGENDFAIMDQIVHQDATPPSQLVKNYPPDLEAIVLRLLARKVDERYQSAEQMLHDLDPFLAQNRLWVSPKPLSRYMRTVFTDYVNAWEQATQDGVTLAQHLATAPTGTGESELMTPPSSFPAVVPLSQAMPAVRASTSDIKVALAVTSEHGAQPAQVADMPSRPTEYPKVKPSRAKIWFALLALGALGGGGYAAFTIVQKDLADTPTAAAPAPSPAPSPSPTPSPSPSPSPAPAPAAAPAPEPEPEAKPPEPAIAKRPIEKHAPPPGHHAQIRRTEHAEPKETPPKDTTPTKDTTKPKDTQPKDQKDPQWKDRPLDSPFLPH